jgi:hypothetical protein
MLNVGNATSIAGSRLCSAWQWQDYAVVIVQKGKNGIGVNKKELLFGWSRPVGWYLPSEQVRMLVANGIS